MALFVDRPVRWSQPFDPGMMEVDIERLLRISPIRFIDEAGFPPLTPLRGILRNDTRFRRYRRGDIIIRKGEYGGSAFLILEGDIRVIIAGDDDRSIIAPDRTNRRGWFGALSQLWSNPSYPEVRQSFGVDLGDNISQEDGPGGAQIFLRDPGSLIDNAETVPLGPGALLGEVGALTRAPRENTVFAESDVEVLEIRFQGLRDLRLHDAGFREYVDDLFRERSLGIRLRAMPMFRKYSEAELVPVIAATSFETVGDIDWYTDFKGSHDLTPAQRLQREPLIITECDYINDLVLLAFGFARVSRVLNGVSRTSKYTKSGDQFGLEQIVSNWRDGGQRCFPDTVRALGYVNVLRIPLPIVEKHILPNMDESDYGEAPALKAPQKTAPRKTAEEIEEKRTEHDQPLLDFLLDSRFMNGRAAMVIDTEKCVRCDECVKACATSHGNNPRFVRQGPSTANIQVTNACMHCADAVCLIGCPTGAIHREISQGSVIIDDQICIGCSMCANSCPYNNIQMVEIRDAMGYQVLDKKTHKPVVKATKCDLCYDQPGGPACQRACPHGALERVNFSDWATIGDLSNRMSEIK